jgi:hypothetical protein
MIGALRIAIINARSNDKSDQPLSLQLSPQVFGLLDVFVVEIKPNEAQGKRDQDVQKIVKSMSRTIQKMLERTNQQV